VQAVAENASRSLLAPVQYLSRERSRRHAFNAVDVPPFRRIVGLGTLRNGRSRLVETDLGLSSDYVLGMTSCVRAAKGRVVSAVRTFLHFLVAEGIAPAQMVKAIPRVRRWRYAKLPKHLSADELALVLNACQTRSKTRLRDRAFHPFARPAGYALR